MTLHASQLDELSERVDEIRVLIVDDHKIFAELLGFALSCEPGMVWVGHATGPDEAVELFRQTGADVVVMDLQLGERDAEGIEVTRRILAVDPAARVVVLTALKDHHLAIDAAAAGAVGFLQKDGSAETVINALRAVSSGYVLVAPTVLKELGHHVSPAAPAAAGSLTAREAEVLALMGEGLTSNLIAVRLQLSRHTVRTHTQSLMAKLGAHSQLETVLRATRLGLLDGPP